MREGFTEFIGLLSTRSAHLLLSEMDGNLPLVTNVLERLMDSVEEWEAQGIMLDPVEFECITDVLVKQYAASFLASQALLHQSRFCEACGGARDASG